MRAQANCVLQPPVVRIDFGSGNQLQGADFSPFENYRRVNHECPPDGSYAILSSTGDCFGGNWVTLSQDHTPGDAAGNMMLVNASIQPGAFFVSPLNGLLPNRTYELAVWLVNVCRPDHECTEIRPNLGFVIENAGRELARFSTGPINRTGTGAWMQYNAWFKTPANAGTYLLKIETKIEGGCGNDFAMDDITIRECVPPPPVVKEVARSKPVIKQPAVTRPVVKPSPPVPKQAKKVTPVVTEKAVADSAPGSKPRIKEMVPVALPKPILTRANPIIKKIETTAAEMVIDLYDNGEIDGDTVSIYHNNELVVSRAGLSEKPITFRITVDELHPHHELVMVANNLGSIPPNTSLMIITARNKRYEVFISSSEQKNAKVVIDLQSQ